MAEAARFRFLYEQLVKRELRQKYKGSLLGIAWYAINPLVLMGAYYLLFGVVLDPPGTYDDYPLFLIFGIVVWLFFSQSLLLASTSLLDQGALIRKARFPREIIPASIVTVQMGTFLIVLALVAVVTVAVRETLDPALLLLPLALALLFAFVLGCALAVSALHAHFRDVSPLLGAVLLPWFFLSPIFFSIEQAPGPERAKWILEWVNPVSPFIAAVRDIVYAGRAPEVAVWLYIAVAAALALVAGRVVFRRLQAELAVLV